VSATNTNLGGIGLKIKFFACPLSFWPWNLSLSDEDDFVEHSLQGSKRVASANKQMR